MRSHIFFCPIHNVSQTYTHTHTHTMWHVDINIFFCTILNSISNFITVCVCVCLHVLTKMSMVLNFDLIFISKQKYIIHTFFLIVVWSTFFFAGNFFFWIVVVFDQIYYWLLLFKLYGFFSLINHKLFDQSIMAIVHYLSISSSFFSNQVFYGVYIIIIYYSY